MNGNTDGMEMEENTDEMEENTDGDMDGNTDGTDGDMDGNTDGNMEENTDGDMDGTDGDMDGKTDENTMMGIWMVRWKRILMEIWMEEQHRWQYRREY